MYFAGDGAKRDEDGYYWLLGRVDDVMNVAGHESARPRSRARWSRTTVAEAAVVSSPDPVTGEAIFAYVILKLGVEATKEHGEALRNHVAEKIGPIAKPKTIMFTPDSPKTRSGKIMRRLCAISPAGGPSAIPPTLADAGVVETIRERSGAGEDE